MALDDEQYAYRGLTFGRNCDIMVNRAEGFEGFEARTSDSDQPRGDGALRGLDYVAPRTIAFELNTWEPDGDGAVYEAGWATIRRTFAPSREADHELTFKRPGAPERMIRCRPIQLVRSEDWKQFNRYGYPPVVLRAVDPRIYSTEEHSANLLPYNVSGGGTDFGIDFAADFTGAATFELVVNNDGDADAFPLIRFYGPSSDSFTAVQLINSTTGQTLDIATTVASGSILTADMAAAVTGAPRDVISMDGASRYGAWALPRRPFALAPGDNLLRMLVTGTSTGVIANLTWHDTWVS